MAAESGIVDIRADRPCVLLCVSGGVAAYKACEVLRLLQKAGCRVKVLMTEHTTHFVDPLTFRSLTHEKVAVGLFDDPADPIHHISLAQEADLALVCPATANVLAKMAHGIADDLMSTTLLATQAPVLVAPAMNTAMLLAPATQENLATLRRRGVHFVEPESGRLACGDVGSGKLAAVDDIAAAVLALLGRAGARDYEGRRVLVTAGGTQEAIDPVRYIGNRSSGIFGYEIARAAARRGAEVTLVSAPCALPTPEGVERVDVVSAADMHAAVSERFDDADMLICAAAVADYTPAHPASRKLKKAHEPLDRVELVETRDILAEMSARRGDRVVIGFAAETHDVLENARAKFARKGCDALVANDVSRTDAGFGSAMDACTWIARDGEEDLGYLPKAEMAERILDRARELL